MNKNQLFGNGELLPIGKQGEQIAYHFLTRLPNVHHVQNVSDELDYRIKEIDFRVVFPGATVDVEVKSDQHIGRSGNVLLEVLRFQWDEFPFGRIGWALFSEAARLLVWCPSTSELYVFEMTTLRKALWQYVVSNLNTINLKIIPSDSRRTTLNVCMPLAYVSHAVYRCNAGNWYLSRKG